MVDALRHRALSVRISYKPLPWLATITKPADPKASRFSDWILAFEDLQPQTKLIVTKLAK